MVRVKEDGTTVMSLDLLKVASGAYEVSVITNLNLSHLKIQVVQALQGCLMLTTLDLSHNIISILGAVPEAASAGGVKKTKPQLGPSAGGGFVTHSAVGGDAPPITSLDGICAVADTLMHLDLSFNRIMDAGPLVHLRRLQTLKLHGNSIPSLDSITPLGTINTLRTLQLQSPDLASNQNPCCTSIERPEYCRVMAHAFPLVRCLDGHYFCRDAVDPPLGDLIGQDFEVKLPETKPWFTEKALQTTNVLDASKCGVMSEKAVFNAVADAKKTAEAARRAFGV